MIKINYVEPLLFSFFFNLGMDMFTSKQLVYKKVCLNYFDSDYCNVLAESKNLTLKIDQDLVQKHTAEWDLYLNVARTLPAVVVSLYLGSWSDHVGRKNVIILPVIGNLLSFVIFLIYSCFIHLSLHFLLIGSIISGIFGSFSAMLQAVCAYVADVSSVKERTKRLALLEFANHFARMLSSLVAGLFIEKFGIYSVYSLAVAISIFQMVYWLFLNESVQSIDDDGNKFRKLINISRVKEVYQILTEKREGAMRLAFFILLVGFLLDLLIALGIMSILVLYLMLPPLALSPSHIGYFFTEISAGRSLGILVMNFFIIHFFRWKDSSFIILGGIANMALAISIGLSSNLWNVYATGAFSLFIGVTMPAIRSSLSKIVSSKEQGRMFSLFACLEVLSTLAFGSMFNAIYKSTVHILPSFTFYVMAGAACVLSLLGVLLKIVMKSCHYLTLIEENNTQSDEASYDSMK